MTGRLSGVLGRWPSQRDIFASGRSAGKAGNSARLAQQQVGPAPVGWGREPRELDGAGEAQLARHRRHRELAFAGHDRQARHHGRIGDFQVIAALALERHPVAERGRQGRRPGTGGQHQPVGGMVCLRGPDRDDAAVLLLDRDGGFAQYLSAVAHERFGREMAEGCGIGAMAVLGDEAGEADVAAEAWLELPQRVGVEVLDRDALGPAERRAARIGAKAGLGAIDPERALLTDQVLGADRFGQGPMGHDRGCQQLAQRAGLGQDLRCRAGPHEAPQPRGGRRQVAPAQRQGPERIREPAGHGFQHAGIGARHDRCAAQPAGIA